MDWVAGQLAAFPDWIPLIGTIVVILFGIVGLSSVLTAESRRRRSDRFDDALAGVMAALGRRATELETWSQGDSDFPRGVMRARPMGDPPSDVDLQSHLDIACMAAPRRHRATVHELTSAATLLTRGRVEWQIIRSGDLCRLTRKWRTGLIDRGEFVSRLDAIEVEVRAQERVANRRDEADERATEQLTGITPKRPLLI